MTSSGKIRIYELSKDLSLDNKDVLDAARKLAIAAKSHSSSISSLEANQIKDFLKTSNGVKASNKTSTKLDKDIVSLKKSLPKTDKDQKPEIKQKSPAQSAQSPSNLKVPLKPNQTLVKAPESIPANEKKLLRNERSQQTKTAQPYKPNKPLPPKPRQEVKPTVPDPLNKDERDITLVEQKKPGGTLHNIAQGL